MIPLDRRVIPLSEPALDGNELDYISDCVLSGWVSSKGPYVQRFESAMADFVALKHAVAVSSGTHALHLALLALGVGPGDEVILPALSYVASANAVVYTGARPVFVDVDDATWNLDLDQVERQVTPRTRVVMPVHLYGHPVRMDVLMAIADEHGLWVLEDACEAHGAEVEGRRVGGIGHIGCFSFYGNKLLTTGEGGMLTTDADELAATARLLRNQACVGESYWHSRVGFSYRLTNLQAAVGLAQLERVDRFIEARRSVGQLYDEWLANVPGLVLYAEPAWSRGVCWLYSLLVGPEFGVSRDALIAYLAA
ncbi:MAG: DegT/DnrJ/EryC1/StrS family aminotransferase [Anaerolineae bacterium]|jgi:perosamine synthetase